MSTAVDTGVDPVAEPTTDPASAGVQPTPVLADGDDEFTARVKADPKFAVDQVKAAQRELSRMKTKLGQVEGVVDAIGGPQALMAHLQRLNALVSNPKGRDLVEHFEKTGEFPSALRTNGAAEPTDPIREPWDDSVDPIKQEVGTLKAELGKLRGERGVEKVRGFFQEFRAEFPLPDEDFKALASAMLDQSKQWSTTEQGRAALEAMNAETFRSLALSKLTKSQLKAALAREDEALRERKAAAATEVPSRSTTGKRATEVSSVLDAFKEAARELGIDPRAPLI
jgi:hypothetical protein